MNTPQTARHRALGLLRDEHRSIAAVLHALQSILRQYQRGEPPNLNLLGAIVHYLIEFPERLHHPAEERYLLTPLRSKTDEAARTLDALEAEHAAGEERVQTLAAALSALAAGSPGALDKLAEDVEHYAAFYWQHMSCEETLLIPLAERHLDDEDWALAEAGFQANHDPMFGNDTANEFARLFSRIVRLAPPPLGYGMADRPVPNA